MSEFDFVTDEQIAIDSANWRSVEAIDRLAAYLNYLEDEAQKHQGRYYSAIREIPDHVA